MTTLPATIADFIKTRSKSAPSTPHLVAANLKKAQGAWLNTPYRHKAARDIRSLVKGWGGRWNPGKKQWLVPVASLTPEVIDLIDRMGLWSGDLEQPPAAEFVNRMAGISHIVLRVPFSEKDQAKADGARWSSAGKFWYFTVVPNDPNFSAKVFKYESRGLVDVKATAMVHNLDPAQVGTSPNSVKTTDTFITPLRPSVLLSAPSGGATRTTGRTGHRHRGFVTTRPAAAPAPAAPAVAAPTPIPPGKHEKEFLLLLDQRLSSSAAPDNDWEIRVLHKSGEIRAFIFHLTTGGAADFESVAMIAATVETVPGGYALSAVHRVYSSKSEARDTWNFLIGMGFSYHPVHNIGANGHPRSKIVKSRVGVIDTIVRPAVTMVNRNFEKTGTALTTWASSPNGSIPSGIAGGGTGGIHLSAFEQAISNRIVGKRDANFQAIFQ